MESGVSQISVLVQSLLNQNGRFQIMLIVLLSLNSIIIGINHTITVFHIYTPKFFCLDNHEASCNFYINGTECPSGYSFDEKDDRTVSVEFQTVCERSMFGPLINSMYFVGVTLGSLICSTLCDKYGRRKLVIICLYGQVLAAVGQYFSKSLEAFIVLRVIQGFFIQGLQTSTYTLIMEFCAPRYRTIAASYWESNWAIGLLILGAVAYFIREWRLLTLSLALVPVILSLSYVWIIPESLVWLETKRKYQEVFRLVNKVARWNNNHEIVEQCKQIRLENCKKTNSAFIKELPNINNGSSAETTATISTVFKSRILRKHIFVMICIWFSVTLSYYGILYYLPNLSGQRHLNFEIGASIELFAYVLAYFIFSSFGRKLPMSCYQYSNGILILILAILTSISDQLYSRYWVICITLIAKGLAVSSFCGMFMYCSELLPTVYRGLGLGICGCAARCGSLLAPQLIALITILPNYVPLTIMSILLIFTASLTLVLPETMKTILPNTVEDADKLWSKR